MSTSFEPYSGSGWAVQPFHYPQAGPEQESCITSQDSDAEIQQREQTAYARGLREGEARARSEHESALLAERKAVSDALHSFDRERVHYYERVESEVVQLALAIARKILNREAHVDPLLLAGMVRVALERLEEGTRVHLRVPSGKELEWRRYFESEARLTRLEVIGDNNLTDEVCVVETDCGATDLSTLDQLKEIENGLFDLMAKKPGVKP